MALATQTLPQAHEIDRSTTLGRLATLPEWPLANLG
jgi:hypothetical protein